MRGGHAIKTLAFTQDGKGDESKCPVARMVNFGRQQLSSQSYDPAPYTSPDYQGTYRMGMGLSPMKPEVTSPDLLSFYLLRVDA